MTGIAENEIWRAVVAGFYEVSNHGRIRRVKPGRRTRPGRILRPTLLPIGYESVLLLKRRRYIHDLVAEAFLGPRPDGFVVDHVDGNKRNNQPSNLEYVTRAENNRRACALGLLPPPPVYWGKENPNAKLDEDSVKEIRIRRANGESLSTLADRFGVSETTISQVALGRAWTHISSDLTDFVVLIDDREKKPYHFPHLVSKTHRLPAGDYSVEQYETRISIERKSKADAYASLGRGRTRFERELVRLSEFEFSAIVVESSLADFLQPPAFTKMNPKAALNSILAWSVKYGVHVYFAGDRLHGNALTLRLLEKFWKYRKAS